MNALATIPHETVEAYLADIEVAKVDVATNVRDDIGDLVELMASIQELGVLEPIVVTEQFASSAAKHGYRLVVGQRRLAAVRELGLTTIPAIVRPAGDVDEPGVRRSIEQLAENLIRKDLNAVEEAVALREVLDADPTLSQAELARRLGMSAPWVSNALRLLGLDDQVQQLVRTGEISASHGKAIAALPEKQQRELAGRAAGGRISSRDLELEIKWKQDAATQDERKKAKTAKWIPKAIAALEAAGVPKDTGVIVTGSYYDADIDAVRRAVKKAGWVLHEDRIFGYGQLPETCTCTVQELTIGGRKPELKRRCAERRHVDQQRNTDHRAEQAEREVRERRTTVLRQYLERELRGTGLHARILQLLADDLSRNGGYYPRDEVADPCTRISQVLTSDWRLRDVDLPTLLGELGLQDPEAAIEAPAPKARKSKSKPEFTPAQLAAARAELGLDGVDS